MLLMLLFSESFSLHAFGFALNIGIMGLNIPPHKKARVIINGTGDYYLSVIQQNQGYLFGLCGVERIELGANFQKPKYAASAVVRDLEIYVPLEGLIDIDVERNRLKKEIERFEKQLIGLNKKLTNSDFLNKAPESVITREKQKKADWETSLEKLKGNLSSLEA